MIFPIEGGKTWDLDKLKVEDWQRSYKSLDVAQELEKARVWLEANPLRRKTAQGMPRFCVNWLNKAATQQRLSQLAGAYYEPKGARPETSEHYSKAYWKARDDGFSIAAAGRIARAKVEAEMGPSPAKREPNVGPSLLGGIDGNGDVSSQPEPARKVPGAPGPNRRPR